jgi:uncharacterized membrane protein YhaH (DUF805 family)
MFRADPNRTPEPAWCLNIAITTRFWTAPDESTRAFISNCSDGLKAFSATIGYPSWMLTYYLQAILHMFDITGRMDRRAFWYFLLMVGAVTCLAIAVDSATVLSALAQGNLKVEVGMSASGTPEVNTGIQIGVLIKMFATLHALPLFTASIRRLHDIGKSGLWMLLHFVPVVGSLTLLSWYARPTDPNSLHGDAPRERLARASWADRTQF